MREEGADAHLIVFLWKPWHVASSELYLLLPPPCSASCAPKGTVWRGAALARICHGAAVGHLMEFVLLLMGQGQWEAGLMTPESAKILPITQSWWNLYCLFTFYCHTLLKSWLVIKQDLFECLRCVSHIPAFKMNNRTFCCCHLGLLCFYVTKDYLV